MLTPSILASSDPAERQLIVALDQAARTGERKEAPEFCANCKSFLHQFADSLGQTVDARDSQTYSHSQQVADLAFRLASTMGLAPVEVDTVHLAGHLHDIGKIGIPDVILKKQGPLTEEEWRWMKIHPEIGAKIVRPVYGFRAAGGMADIILSHHERFDGTGYPNGLKGAEVPLGARIIAVADTVSALIEDRPYRRGTSLDAAFKEIVRCSGTQFDPCVVEALHQVRAVEGLEFLLEDSASNPAVPQHLMKIAAA